MATQADVRRIALALPETVESEERFAFSVMNKGKPKGILWSWMERVDPKKPRVPRSDVIAIRVASLEAKDALISANPKVYFTEPHYNGYPAVLVRLKEIGKAELTELIVESWRRQAPEAWRRQAPKALTKPSAR